MVKMTLVFDEETIETLKAKARKEGFVRPTTLARYLLLRGLRENAAVQLKEDEDTKTVAVPVDNYRELQGYVEEKKIGSVAVFAAFAMHQYMSRNSLSDAQKRRVEERHGISLNA
jgi:hypothetical protein